MALVMDTFGLAYLISFVCMAEHAAVHMEWLAEPEGLAAGITQL